MTESAEIAKALNRECKSALVNAIPNYAGQAFMSTRKYTAATWDRLLDLGLIHVVDGRTMLTKFGLEVAAILRALA